MHLQRSSNGQLLGITQGTALGFGGEARIYRVAEAPGLAAKVYHRPTADHAAKLAAMLANPPDDPLVGEGHVSIAWPSDLLLAPDGSGRVMGFLMPLAKGMSPLINFYHPKTRRHRHPLFNYRYLLRTGRNLAACLGALHARGYVVGDLNESNILVSETALVTLVDTDSFQVTDPGNGRLFRCRVGRAEFTPPELQRVRFELVDRKPEHDLFGLAVLIFQLLMEGTHPFAGRHTGKGEPPSLERRIAAGQFPYWEGEPTGLSPMPSAPRFEALHPKVRELFLRCFAEGFSAPSRRPDAPGWQGALEEAEASLVNCPVNEQHRYDKSLPDCPWCKRQRLLSGLDPFPSREAVQKREHLRSVSKRSRTRRAVPRTRWLPRTQPRFQFYVRPRARFGWAVLFVVVIAGIAAFWVWALSQ
jgi:DNA-binding helix-hairpin-helix protein with protein kinase domain